MCMELGDGATYPMRGVYSIYFYMSWGDVIELDNVLFVLGLKKNILSISYTTNLLRVDCQ
jgi:hypothetical protein